MLTKLLKVLVPVLGGLLMGCEESTEVVVKADVSTRYQKMEGFGGFGAQKVWWDQAPYFDDSFVELLIDDLGLTILRDEIPINFEPKNDNDDPYITDLSKYNLAEPLNGSHTTLNEHFKYLRALENKGLDKLIVSIWSPPVWMKHNGIRGNGLPKGENRAPDYVDQPGTQAVNQLKRKYYDEFAEYCVAYIRLLKQETDIDLYAISLQNEPRFSQWYGSAVYSPTALADLISAVGQRFEQEGIQVKIFAPEDVSYFERIKEYIQVIGESKLANQYTDAIAVHGYKNDGITEDHSTPDKWRKTFKLAESINKPLWMTETSGYESSTYDGGFLYTKAIYSALYYGNVSAWVYWQMSGPGHTTFIKDNELTYLYHLSKHYYRHIKPGATRIKVDTNSETLYAIGFLSKSKDSLTFVLINDSDYEKNLNVENIEGGKCWVSNTEALYQLTNCSNGSVSIPAHGVLTMESNVI